jgi:hypothetical protein
MGKARQARDKVKEMEERLDHELEVARQLGRQDALQEIIDFLETQFMRPDVEITSVQGSAILAVAGEVVARFKPEALKDRVAEERALDPAQVAAHLKDSEDDA